jgi:WhiB family redox-sensing transcriptional regulator
MITTDWQLDALCAQIDPEIFFPEKGGSPAAAKKICHTCTVKDTCLEAGLAKPGTIGVWGGTTPKERRRITRGREIKRRQPTRMVNSRRLALALLAEGKIPTQVAAIVGVSDRTIFRWKAAA